METCDVVLTFESVDEILWCDHSNEISLAVLSQGTVCLGDLKKNEMKFSIILNFKFWPLLGVKGLSKCL